MVYKNLELPGSILGVWRKSNLKQWVQKITSSTKGDSFHVGSGDSPVLLVPIHGSPLFAIDLKQCPSNTEVNLSHPKVYRLTNWVF